eukprot:881672-Pyramimonas_sp.AAC.1
MMSNGGVQTLAAHCSIVRNGPKRYAFAQYRRRIAKARSIKCENHSYNGFDRRASMPLSKECIHQLFVSVTYRCVVSGDLRVAKRILLVGFERFHLVNACASQVPGACPRYPPRSLGAQPLILAQVTEQYCFPGVLHIRIAVKLGETRGRAHVVVSAGASSTSERPVLLLDVMDTIVRDPFYEDMPAYFNCTMKELFKVKHPTAWINFEKGLITEDEFRRSFYADLREFSESEYEGLKACMYEGYAWLDGMPPNK